MIGGTVALLALSAVVILLARSEPRLKLVDDLPAGDREEILYVVRRELRRELFPGLSVRNLVMLPRRLQEHLTERTVRVDVQDDGSVEVLMALAEGPIIGEGIHIGEDPFRLVDSGSAGLVAGTRLRHRIATDR
jgi:hypothetical protein